MRFRLHLNEYRGPSSGRGKTIEQDAAIDILTTKCKKSFGYYQKTGISLYRGMPSKGDFYQIDPRKGKPRVSQYTDNRTKAFGKFRYFPV